MRPLKVFVFLNIIIAVLAVLAYLIVTQLVFKSSERETTANTEDNNTKISGVVINSLVQPSVDGKLLFYVNGDEFTNIIEYKLSSGREKTYAQISPNTTLVILANDYLYWVETVGSQESFYRAEPSTNTKGELLFKPAENYKIIGIKIFNKDEIYVTTYFPGTGENINNSIIKIQGKKITLIKEFQSPKAQIVAGKDTKGQLILQNYDVSTGLTEFVCTSLKTMQSIGCEQIAGVAYLVNTPRPTSEGYLTQQKGYIDLVDKKGVSKRLLEGQEDEHFESAHLVNNKVYFISGQITATGGTTGKFEPLYLESIGIDGKNRTKLKLLPSANEADIEYVDDKMVLLSLSEKSSDKNEAMPGEIWIYNFSSKDLKALTSSKCSIIGSCDAIFLMMTK